MDGWAGRPSITWHMNSTEMEALARCFSTGLHAAIEQRLPFVKREKKKVARSRRYRLIEVEWNNKTAVWDVEMNRVSWHVDRFARSEPVFSHSRNKDYHVLKDDR